MAEDFEPVRQSYLVWMISALGWRYSLLLPLAGLSAFAGVLFLVLRGKGPAMVGALILIVPLPFLVGVVGVLDGMLSSFQVIGASDLAPKPSAIATAVSMSLFSAWVGLLFSVPSYLAAVFGLITRSFIDPDRKQMSIPAEVVHN